MKAEFQVTYFLWRERVDKNGMAPVYIRSKQNSKKQISYDTGERVHRFQWPAKDPKKSTAKRTVYRPLKNLPVGLIDLTKKLKDTYRDRKNQGYTGEDLALDKLWEHKDGPSKPTGKNILAWCKDYQSGDYSEGQKKAVRTLKANINAFNKSLTFDQLPCRRHARCHTRNVKS